MKDEFAAQKTNSKGKNIRNILIFFLICVIVMGGAYYFSRTFLVVFPIKGASMENTLYEGDYVMVFRTKKVNYDDVVILHWPGEEDTKFLVKRVVGLGGDKIEIKLEDGLFHVYRNGEMVTEKYNKEPMTGNYREFDAVVPEGKVFFLGDNRMDSLDSHVGNFYADIEDIQGIAFMKYKGLNIKFL